MLSSSTQYCGFCGVANSLEAGFCSACGRSLPEGTSSMQQESALLARGAMLQGRYSILEEIGQGGFGAVYKATDAQLADRIVALKELSQSNLSAREMAEATENFKQEVFLLARLKHPNLPSIYDYFTEVGRWYVVMEFIAGETLEDYLARGGNGRQAGAGLPVAEVLQIGLQLCTVLEYLHTRQPPIIFRDLKPANIMRAPDGKLYLIDFGIARIFKQGKAKDTIALGSPGYAAPEQYGKAQTTPRSDIYGLGATLHELVTASDPSLSPFVFTAPQLPAHADLSALIMRMLEPGANNRPAGITEVKQALESIATGRPPGLAERVYTEQGPPIRVAEARGYAEPGAAAYSPISNASGQAQQQMYMPYQSAPPPLPSQRGISRRTMLVGLAGLFVLGGVVLSHLPRREEAVATYTPKHDFPTFDSDGSNAFPLAVPATALLGIAWSPNGKSIVTAAGTGTVQVLDAVTRTAILTYRGHTAAVSAVAWSPDGKLVASADYDQAIQVWDPYSGNTIMTYRERGGPVLSVAWSPDSKRLVSGSFDRAVLVWDTSSGRKIGRYDGHSDQVSSVAWSPNGQYIACGSADRTVQVLEATTLNGLYTFSGHTDVVQSVAWSPNNKRIVSTSNDQTVQVWDAANGGNVFVYRGHADQVWSAAWSPDGQRIVSGSLDATVQLWEAADGGNVTTFENDSQVVSVAWSPDGRSVISGDVNGELKEWSVK